MDYSVPERYSRNIPAISAEEQKILEENKYHTFRTAVVATIESIFFFEDYSYI